MAGLKYRSLLLRGNRLLGSSLVSAGLISEENQQNASQKLLEVIQADNLKAAGLLYILLYDLHALKESALITQQLEKYELGLIDLHNFAVESTFDSTLDLELCWSTWTLPFDRVDGIHLVASCYYLSDPIRKHWEGVLNGQIMWYVISIAGIMEALERISAAANAKSGAPAA